MSAFPSLRLHFEIRTVGSRVFTRNPDGGDSALWPRQDRSRTWRAVACAILLAAGIFSPLSAHADEVSIAQISPGAKLRVVGRAPMGGAPHPASDATPAALRKIAEDAATSHTLPVNYFLRLIRQESGFNPLSVSAAGAQGIAQFTPATAFERGLKDPFDPAEALPKSAQLLSDLKAHFGNLGLAAAAYNAGPERVRKWLAGQGALPQETIDYVRVVTGHEAA